RAPHPLLQAAQARLVPATAVGERPLHQLDHRGQSLVARHRLFRLPLHAVPSGPLLRSDKNGSSAASSRSSALSRFQLRLSRRLVVAVDHPRASATCCSSSSSTKRNVNAVRSSALSRSSATKNRCSASPTASAGGVGS